jgi:pentatricopeptide repeat protein
MLLQYFTVTKDIESASALFDHMFLKITSDEKIFTDAVYTELFQFCLETKSSELGKRVLLSILKTGRPETSAENSSEIFSGGLAFYRQLVQIETPTIDILNALLYLCRGAKQFGVALDIYQFLKKSHIEPDQTTRNYFFAMCISSSELDPATIAQVSKIVETVLGGETFSRLFREFVTREKIETVFEAWPGVQRYLDLASWNFFFEILAQKGKRKEAFDLLRRMKDGPLPSERTFIILANMCASIGIKSHAKNLDRVLSAKKFRNLDSPELRNSLLRMRVMCSSYEEGLSHFLAEKDSDVRSWETIFLFCEKHKKPAEARNFFQEMKSSGLSPTPEIYGSLISVCSAEGYSEFGKFVYDSEVPSEMKNATPVCQAILKLTTKTKGLDAAVELWSSFTENWPDLETPVWNTMISISESAGSVHVARRIFSAMISAGATPDAATFIPLLELCAAAPAPILGEEVRDRVKATEYFYDPHVFRSLLKMEATCRGFWPVFNLFEKRLLRRETPVDLITWNFLFQIFRQTRGSPKIAADLFSQMVQESHVVPDEVTFTTLFAFAAEAGSRVLGNKIYSSFLSSPLASSPSPNLIGASINLKGKLEGSTSCLALLPEWRARAEKKEDGQKFGVSLWNALFSSCDFQEIPEKEIVKLFQEMLDSGVIPDATTFVSVLGVCSKKGMSAKNFTKKIWDLLHTETYSSLLSDPGVLGSLLHASFHCLSMDHLLSLTQRPNIVSSFEPGHWNSVIIFSAKKKKVSEAVRFFLEAQQRNVRPSVGAYLALFLLCSRKKLPDIGKKIHDHLVNSDDEKLDHPRIGAALVTMYGACEGADSAREFFRDISEFRDPVDLKIWNAMMAVYRDQGDGNAAAEIFKEMEEKGVKPDKRSFEIIFGACTGTKSPELFRSFQEKFRSSEFRDSDDSGLLSAFYTALGTCEGLSPAISLLRSTRPAGPVLYSMIRLCVEKEDLETALKLLEEVKDRAEGKRKGKGKGKGEGPIDHGLTESDYMALISACLKKKNLKIVTLVLQKWKQSRVRDTKNSVLAGWVVMATARVEGLSSALHLFNKYDAAGLDFGVAIWNGLFHQCLREKNIPRCQELWEKISEKKVTPTAETYIVLFKICGRTGATEFAEPVLARFVGSPFVDLSDENLARNLIGMHACLHGIEQARSMLAHVASQRGKFFSAGTWDLLVSVAFSKRDFDQAILLLREMRGEGLEPSLASYQAAMRACVGLGVPETGEEVVGWVRDSILGREEGEEGLLSAVIVYYERTSNLGRAVEVLEEIEDAGKKIKPAIWNWVLRSARKLNDLETAYRLLPKLFPKEGGHPSTYVTVLRMCESAQNLEEGKKVRQQILSYVSSGVTGHYDSLGESCSTNSTSMSE